MHFFDKWRCNDVTISPFSIHWLSSRENCTPVPHTEYRLSVCWSIEWVNFSSCIFKTHIPQSSSSEHTVFITNHLELARQRWRHWRKYCSTSSASYSNIHLHTIKFKILNTRDFNIKCWFFHFFSLVLSIQRNKPKIKRKTPECHLKIVCLDFKVSCNLSLAYIYKPKNGIM